jgi:hypothetical protein
MTLRAATWLQRSARGTTIERDAPLRSQALRITSLAGAPWRSPGARAGGALRLPRSRISPRTAADGGRPPGVPACRTAGSDCPPSTGRIGRRRVCRPAYRGSPMRSRGRCSTPRSRRDIPWASSPSHAAFRQRNARRLFQHRPPFGRHPPARRSRRRECLLVAGRRGSRRRPLAATENPLNSPEGLCVKEIARLLA